MKFRADIEKQLYLTTTTYHGPVPCSRLIIPFTPEFKETIQISIGSGRVDFHRSGRHSDKSLLCTGCLTCKFTAKFQIAVTILPRQRYH